MSSCDYCERLIVRYVSLLTCTCTRVNADVQERLAQYAAKKAKKPQVIAKSSLLLDVKPWDDETDMAELEKCVRWVRC